ncbi:scytonemin biosynthesis cyclase/decarboxylase ScyC [Chlorogloeopsis sp. ULAP01]|uniref:scytonemin biosynthesis cyclase/decarboxylase ScyC n=1 Tax=Chlorogloeopsis sp. ULAP01 TaxID=3056483 RepID=UPI0025AB528C|nr:scytonemin biosynthesis cyclase/decarboxylase ScyC [Chlorogloeopsis sp. ULAP01]MDM9380403.1 scytonemin biosynthesis cyclase/decarboxylase ScyC [Chlorogloeopsis sp. ULAP01]
MESNTFATSAYIATSPETAFKFLCRLETLDEWTINCRMLEKVDDNTWIGTCAGYQNNLYYHLKKIENPLFMGIEWYCGFTPDNYFHWYPVLLFPTNYIEPESKEQGVYFHWISFVDPKRRTPMIMEGIRTVHMCESRSLKASLERNQGIKEAAQGQYTVDSDTIYIDAPIELALEYLADIRNIENWSHMLRSHGEIAHQSGNFLDEYNQTVKITFRTHTLNNYYLIEQDYLYPDYQFLQRSPTLLIPCSRAFNDLSARGFILHRIAFWQLGKANRHGKLQIEDYGAENMNIKRLLEAKAGNFETFARGISYIPTVA